MQNFCFSACCETEFKIYLLFTKMKSHCMTVADFQHVMSKPVSFQCNCINYIQSLIYNLELHHGNMNLPNTEKIVVMLLVTIK
jgi:hypothetical protein